MNLVTPFVLVIVLGLVIIFEPFGLQFADWNEPITMTDLTFAVGLIVLIIMSEVRYAGRWVVEKITGTKP